MKKIVKNYLIIGLSLGLILGFIHPQFIVQSARSLAISCGFIAPKTADQKKDTREHFSEQLAQQEKAAWQELEKIGITRNQFEQAKEELKENYAREDVVPANSKSVSAETARIIKTVLEEFGVDNNTPIVAYDIQAPIAASDNILFVNEAIFNQFSLPAQRFVVAHEIQHMRNQDTVSTFTINKLRESDEQETDADHPINKFTRFREERADIQTALTSKHWAENYQTFAKEISKKWGDTEDPTHPKNSERLTLAQNIVNHMNNQVIA